MLLLTAVALVSAAMMGNDSSYYASGDQLFPLLESDICVEKEVLTISIRDDKYADVDVEYVFFNPGKERTLTVGFESMHPYPDDDADWSETGNPYIKDFSVVMNGETLPCKVAVIEAGKFATADGKVMALDKRDFVELPEEYHTLVRKTDSVFVDWSYAYHFKARFKPGRNVVRHKYSYQMGESVGYAYSIDYKLTPAARWAGGRIGDFTLIVKADRTRKHFVVDGLPALADSPTIHGQGKWRLNSRRYAAEDANLKESVEVVLRNAEVSFHIEDFSPSKELAITSADCIETNFRLYSDPSTVTYEQSSPYLYLYDLDTNRPKDANKVAWARRVLRNMPFAVRGYVFKDARLRSFFESLWWYMPDPDYVANAIELPNDELNFILEIEREK